MRELGLENELLRKGRAEGRAEGEQERKKLEKENASLKEQLRDARKT